MRTLHIWMGKPLLPSNAPTVRPTSDTQAVPIVHAAAATPNEPPTAESLGWQLRAALPPLRLHSVSLYDDHANVLWLSEGALGPDEHGLVTEAIETLRRETAQSCHENRLEDGRIAIFLAVRAPQGALVGLCMILADIKSVGEGVIERIITPQVRTVLQKIAVLLRPAGRTQTNLALKIVEISAPEALAPAPQVGSTAPGHATEATQVRAALPIPPPPIAPTKAPATAPTRREAKPSEAGTSGSLPKLAPTSGGTTSTKALQTGATTTSRTLELPEGLTLSLDVQPFTKLRPGGRTRRYEVTARATHRDMQCVPAGLDNFVLQRLLASLAANRASWNAEQASFTLNLSIATLEDERFPQFIASNLKRHGIAAESIGFEIAEPLCLQKRAQVERFISLCDRIGCFVVIDDFSLDSSAVSLLRSKALRLVKIDPRLTSVALKDKLAQALVVAIAQAVKVLGIHCAAKRVDSQASLQWLTAIGCDFAQGAVLGAVQPLESLTGPAAQSTSPG